MEQSCEGVLRFAAHELSNISTSPRLDAELLLAAALGIDRTALHINLDKAVTHEELETFYVFLDRRKKSEPLAYILGTKEFYGLEFKVNHNVLVPRPETELLIELALRHLNSKDPLQELKILDLGTGSGCIAVTLAKELKKLQRDFEVLAVDASSEALEVAADNALKHGVSGEVVFIEGSWFDEFDEEDKFDLIISNPPYVSTKQDLPKDLSFEPKEALYAGINGMDDIEILITKAVNFMQPDAIFLCEIGETQREAIVQFYNAVNLRLSQPYHALNFYQDLAGKDRVMEILGK